MNLKKIIAENLIRAVEAEMHTNSPKCPVIYYQPARPTKIQTNTDKK